MSVRRHRQAGQVLVVTALMILVMVCGILVGIDMGRLVLARIKFQNGADSAALASVAVKVGKHHFDTAWRWSMQQEAYKARLEILWSDLIILDTVLNMQAPITPIGPIPGTGNGPPIPVPSGPPVPSPALVADLNKARTKYATQANKAYIYAARMHDMDKTLAKLYQDWPETFTNAAYEAARIGWELNIDGFESDGNGDGRTNAQQLASPGDMPENSGGQPTIGGFAYANEKAGANGLYGKSIVQMDCGVVPFSLGFNGLTRVQKQYKLRVNAGAQPVSTLTGKPTMVGGRYNFTRQTPIGGLPIGPRMQWLRPALFSIVGSEAGPLH